MTIVYRIYNRVGALLDVGYTHHTYWRLTCLASVKTWWREVTTIQLDRLSSVQAAKERARKVVAREHPSHLSVESGEPSRRPQLH